MRLGTAGAMAALVAALAGCAVPPSPSVPVSPPASSKPAVSPKPAAPAPKPPQLKGLSRAQILDLLGPPTSRHDRAMATVWVYRAGRCSLTLMFYPEIAATGLRVLDVHFGDPKRAAACYARLRERHLRHGR